MVELVWVLEGSYQFEKKRIIEILEGMLRSSELVLEQTDTLRQALRQFETSRADFADCLIERCAHAAECEYTLTFDRRATIAGMRLLR
jgi:predicted nucleic-acid-binding protein